MSFVRIGERLVQAGVITAATLDKALAAQVIHGARLCTNIVELAHLDLDVIAVQLAKHHGLPPALSRHFAIADATLQRTLSAEIAGRMCVVPLGHLPGERIAIAVRDPLVQVELDELAAVFGREISQAVAPELRIFYYIERAYGLRRDTRFLRVRRGGTQEIPLAVARLAAAELPAQPSSAPPLRGRAPTHLGVDDIDIGGLLDADGADHGDDDFDIDVTDFESDFDELEQTGTRLPDIGTDPTGERRRFVHALDEPDETPVEKAALGRIAIRRVAKDGAGTVRELSFEDTLRGIRRATGRDAVGDLVIAGLRDHIAPPLAAGAVFVCRGGLAIGWRGFVRGTGEIIVDELAIPLDAASSMQRVALNGHPLLGAPAASELDKRMWKHLGAGRPVWVGCAPIDVHDTTVALVYAHATAAMDEAAGHQIVELATRAGQAFERLIRAAER